MQKLKKIINFCKNRYSIVVYVAGGICAAMLLTSSAFAFEPVKSGVQQPASVSLFDSFPFLNSIVAFFKHIESQNSQDAPTNPLPPITITPAPSLPTVSTQPAPPQTSPTYNTYNTYVLPSEKNSSSESTSDVSVEIDTAINKLRSEIFSKEGSLPASGGVQNIVALSQHIDSLSNVTLHGVSGLTASDIPTLNYLPIGGGTLSGQLSADVLVVSSTTATSTFANGIDLASGCFAIGGVCITGGGGGVDSVTDDGAGTLTISPNSGSVLAGINLAHENSWTGLQQFSNASSTIASAYNAFYVGTTATTTISGIATSTFAAPISSVSGNLIIASSGTTNKLLLNPYGGNVGIGTSSPSTALAIQNTISSAQFRIGYDATRYADLQINSAGDLLVASQSGKVNFNDNTVYVCSGGACPTTFDDGAGGSGSSLGISGNGNLQVESAMYIGNFKIAPTAATTTALSIYDNVSGAEVFRIDKF